MQSACPFPATAAAATGLLEGAFGSRPRAVGWAPGRVNLIGEHVDYCGGFVLPAAIDRGTVVAVAPGEPGRLRAVSREQPGSMVDISVLEQLASAPAWGRYVAGVVHELGRAGVPVSGLDVAVASDVPVGAGLSSSAAIEVSTASAVQHAASRILDDLEVVRLCQRAEREHAGVPCGIMDQYAAMFGRAAHAVLIDCHHLSHRYVHLGPAVSLVIVDSGVKHELAGGEYADRRSACERGLAAAIRVLGPRETLRHVRPEELDRLAKGVMDATEFRRVRHVVTECARTIAAAEAMERGEYAEAGRLMYESHASLRDDFEVSCAELDEIVQDAVRLPGVFGARMTGGGFGGSAVALVQTERAEAVMQSLEQSVRRCFVVRPGDGAGGRRANEG